MRVNLKRHRFENSDIQRVLREFRWISSDVVAVGGCVRDFLLEREYDDIDIASSVRPEKVIELAKQHNYELFESGVEHGTVTLKSKSTNQFIEHTTFRSDVSTDGRRATVQFANSFRIDSERRDFTFNAMAFDVNGKLYDFHKGLNDLNEGLLRFVGDSNLRLEEDKLRALRAFRFACRFDCEIQPDDLYLIESTFKDNFLDKVSTERIFMELEKAMKFSDERLERFLRYVSFYVLPNTFGMDDGWDNLKKLSHPSVVESKEFDALIHNMFWDFENTSLLAKLPLTPEISVFSP